jgi:hypothetical protein
LIYCVTAVLRPDEPAAIQSRLESAHVGGNLTEPTRSFSAAIGVASSRAIALFLPQV